MDVDMKDLNINKYVIPTKKRRTLNLSGLYQTSDLLFNKNILDIRKEFKGIKDNIKVINIKLGIQVPPATQHLGIKCNQCNQVNFTGIRYKCFTCNNFNVCNKCEKSLSFTHDKTHFFLRIHDTSLYNSLI